MNYGILYMLNREVIDRWDEIFSQTAEYCKKNYGDTTIDKKGIELSLEFLKLWNYNMEPYEEFLDIKKALEKEIASRVKRNN